MTLETLLKVKQDLVETKKGIEESIDTMAHKYALTILQRDFGLVAQQQCDEIVSGLLAHGRIANKTSEALDEEIANLEKAIEVLIGEKGEE